jgi:hypothetical protein
MAKGAMDQFISSCSRIHAAFRDISSDPNISLYHQNDSEFWCFSLKIYAGGFLPSRPQGSEDPDQMEGKGASLWTSLLTQKMMIRLDCRNSERGRKAPGSRIRLHANQL